MAKKVLIALGLMTTMVFNSVSVFAEKSGEETTAEGYTEESEDYTAVVDWIENGDKNIFGKFYYPSDYEDGKSYPVIIMCHGTDGTHAVYEKCQWPMKMAENGYISYVFDFCGGSQNSLSDGTLMELSGETMLSDIDAIMDYVKEQSFCDENQIYLMGQSRGGIMAAMEAGRRADEVAGLMLMYPGFYMIDRLHEEYPDLSVIEGQDTITDNGNGFGTAFLTDVYDWDVAGTCSQFKGNVLLVHGIADTTVPYTASLDALNNYYADSSSELVLVSGKQSVHAFDAFYEAGQEIAWNAAINYMNEQVELNSQAE